MAMFRMVRHCVTLAAFALALFDAGLAHADCTVTGVSTVTGLNANLGAYSSTSGASTTISVTVTINKTTGTGNCPVLRLAFKGPTKPATANGPSTPKLSYDVLSPNNQSILYTGSPGSTIQLNQSQPVTISPTQYSITTTVRVVAAAGQSLPNGNYSDSSVVAVILSAGGSVLTGPQPPLLVNATVNNPRSCTVGGSLAPSSGTATIPVTSNGLISSTAPIAPTLPLGTNVSCTGLGAVSISLSSQNGKLRGPSNSNASFANTIDYSASASVAGGSVSATPASYNSATGASSAGSSTNLATGAVSGSLSVSITPVSPGKPLVAGQYSDTLTISINPQ